MWCAQPELCANQVLLTDKYKEASATGVGGLPGLSATTPRGGSLVPAGCGTGSTSKPTMLSEKEKLGPARPHMLLGDLNALRRADYGWVYILHTTAVCTPSVQGF